MTATISVVVCTMGMCVCMPELETALLHTFYYLFLFSPVAKDYRPIVQVLDNIERNHKLGCFLTDCLALADEFAVFHSKEYW